MRPRGCVHRAHIAFIHAVCHLAGRGDEVTRSRILMVNVTGKIVGYFNMHYPYCNLSYGETRLALQVTRQVAKIAVREGAMFSS
jgi:hypothetical protein